MVENTVLCNLRCPSCRRGDLLKVRKRKNLTIDDTVKISRIIKEYKIKSVYYFNLGEPYLPNKVLQKDRIKRRHNPEIRILTSTNGMLLDSDEKIEAALLMDYIYISLDGIDQQMVTRYQVGSDYNRVYKNMARLVEIRNQRGVSMPIVNWKYVLFRWNDHPSAIRMAVAQAKAAGVDLISFHRGFASFFNRSLRYPRHPIFRSIGEEIEGATVVNFNNIPRHLLSL
jgi:pyruvate-formate lyase-activating enzyme